MNDPHAQILAGMRRGLDQTQVRETPLASAGTSFPSSPPTGMRFFRTDLGLDCYYDGTRWLTVNEYELALTPFAINPLPFTGAGPSTILLAALRTDYRPYYTRFSLYIFTNTTNNGTNYWSVTLTDSGATGLWTPNTSADAVGQATKDTTAAVLGTNGGLYVNAQLTKVGAPGSVSAFHMTVVYRLVVP